MTEARGRGHVSEAARAAPVFELLQGLGVLPAVLARVAP